MVQLDPTCTDEIATGDETIRAKAIEVMRGNTFLFMIEGYVAICLKLGM
jgi:hypothetical protein